MNFFVKESGLFLQSSESVLKKKYMHFQKKIERIDLGMRCEFEFRPNEPTVSSSLQYHSARGFSTIT